jgi:D-glycero-D-manno-heptose 1,7-bisphosphate phosphatase
MAKAKALFLDRDGVINIEREYVYRREDFTFQDGIFELCRAAQSLGYLLLVVTNQAGIARGYYAESEFLDLTDWMIAEFKERGVVITKVYYCPHHPVRGLEPYRIDSPDRKPKPGMFLRAQADYNVDLEASALIGDKLSDIQAAEAAGVGTKIWLGPPGDYITGTMQCHVAESLEEIRARFFRDDGRGLNVFSLFDDRRPGRCSGNQKL